MNMVASWHYWPAYLLIGSASLCVNQVQAAYSCNMSATSTGALYSTSSNVDTNGTVTINCTRAAGDANTLTYRIKADNGLNVSGSQRRVRLGATANYINYYLRRGTTVGGTATCGSTTTWQAPTTGTTNVITGTLSFGAALSASATWGYCIRLPSGSSPTAGAYTDTLEVFAQFPNSNAGDLSDSALLMFTAGVGNQCVFTSFPTTINFNYTSFSASAQTSSQSFNLRCSNALPWSVSITPASSTLLGLNYNLTVSPTSGTGNGTNQAITLNGAVPANQAGSCANAVCTGSQTHNMLITY